MKVSVIIPIYEVEEDIRRCLISVVTQNYLDLEIILVDDASPDNSVDLAKRVLHEYGFLEKSKFILHQKNMGLSVARNSGVEAASGEYIFFLDSDDELATTDSISYLVSIVQSDKEPIDIVSGNFYRIIDNEIISVKEMNALHFFKNKDIFKSYSNSLLSPMACGKLISRRFLQANDILFRPGLYHEDELWFFDVVRKAKRIKVTPKVVYNYWVREGSIMSNITEKHVQDLNYIILEMYREHCSNKEYYPREMANIIEKFRRISLDRLISFTDNIFIESEVRKLKKVNFSPLQSGRMRFFKKNILLRMPNKFIIWYLSFKRYKNNR